jgi:hypothetical protein
MTRMSPLLVAVAAVAICGCGNSDEPAPPNAAKTSGTAKPRLSKQEFRRASSRICVRGDRQMRAFIPLGTDPATRRANRNGVIAVLRKQNDDLHALGVPAGALARVFEDVYRSVDVALDRAAKDETADIEQEVGAALMPYLDTLRRYTPDCAG